MPNQNTFEDLPVGTVVRQDRGGWYFVLPNGTTRRRSVIIGWDGVTVVQTDMTRHAAVKVSVHRSQLR
jgi:hypothetical protein